jgi:transcription elongation GreA/GreB family factor
MDKVVVHASTLNALSNKIASLQEILDETYQYTLDDSKSSAGDKHETSIAMVQLEQEKLSKQLNEFLKQQRILLSINPTNHHQLIQLGSLVETKQAWYYFSIGIGLIPTENNSVFAINPDSPLGQLLMKKKAGESVTFNGIVTEIIAVY